MQLNDTTKKKIFFFTCHKIPKHIQTWQKTSINIKLFPKNFVRKQKSSNFALAYKSDGPFVYRLGREIFIL